MPEIERELSCEGPVGAIQENEVAFWLTGARLNAATVETSAAQIGEGVTLAALCDAREQGCRFGVVGASEVGENVNLRRGFEQYCLLQMHDFMHDPERRPV